jgi:uncharacterized phiE125 gp8 family phage protein
MKRAIVAPHPLSPAALGELKAWLGLSIGRDDDELVALLGAALELCEGFIGLLPLTAGCEDTLPAACDWQPLSARPVQAITGVAALAIDGTRRALLPAEIMLELDADGDGRVRLVNRIAETRLVASYTAGLAASWETLPEAVRQGVIRLAAHQHREREGDKPMPVPPAAVAALWRPWRRVHLT